MVFARCGRATLPCLALAGPGSARCSLKTTTWTQLLARGLNCPKSPEEFVIARAAEPDREARSINGPNTVSR